MPRSILIVTPFYYEPPRHKTCVQELAIGLSRRTKVAVISSLVEGAKPFEQHPNLNVYRFRPWWYARRIPYMIDPFLWRKVLRVAHDEETDIIFAVS